MRHFSMSVSLLLFLLSVALFRCEDLPHPGCEMFRLSEADRAEFRQTSDMPMPSLWCEEQWLDIPTNFNVTRLPEDLEGIVLRSENGSSILRENAQPIPFRPNLTEIEMTNFRGSSQGQRPPIEKFLQHNKHQLVELGIKNVPLHYLNKSFFDGFHALVSMKFMSCSLESLDADTFAPLALAKPGLGILHLDFNALSHLDWSVFQPMAKSLRKLELQGQRGGITSLYRSGPKYYFDKLCIMGLMGNRLKTVPNEILQSIPKLLHCETSMGFDSEEFCTHSECSCCHLRDFMQWAMIQGDQFPMEYAQNWTEHDSEHSLHLRSPNILLWKVSQPGYLQELFRIKRGHYHPGR